MSAMEEQENIAIEEKSLISGIQALDMNENLEPAAGQIGLKRYQSNARHILCECFLKPMILLTS